MNRLIAVMAIAVTAFLFVIPAWAQAVSVVTLTNGPPNIPNASPCTPTTCTWIGAGWPSGTHVSLVYADLIPISANYSGIFSLSDQPGHTGDASHFTIATASDGTRNVGEIKTSGTVAAGDYFVTVTANGASGANTQNVTVHAASGTNVACGASIPTSGTVLLSPSCTYTLHVSNGTSITGIAANTVYIGAGNGGTIIDGGGDTCWAADTFNSGGAGDAFIGIQLQNYGGRCLTNAEGQANQNLIQTAVNGVVRNSRFVNNSASGVAILEGGAFVANNYFNHMGYGTITPNSAPSPRSTAPVTVIGNDLGDANYLHNNVCDDAGIMKITSQGGTSYQLNLINNYWHDSAAGGPWTDFFSGGPVTMSGNTLARNGDKGMINEQTFTGWSVDHNVFYHIGDGSQPNSEPPNCGGEAQTWPAARVDGGANVNVHDNNISVYTVFDPALGSNKTGQAFVFADERFNCDPNCNTNMVNNTFHNNTVNFFTRDSNAFVGWYDTAFNTSGASANNNHYHLVGGNTSTDQHWFWFGQGNTSQTFANYRSSSGQDANSTIDTTDTSTAGCTHVACPGSGIGAGGVPLTGPSSLNIQSVALSNSTFTPNVANGAVGTVSVTMSDGSAFSGKLSITGTNSGGFQLSGNSLQEKASGTPAGTYRDFNIVATQSTASNSPQQISPTVTGVVEAPFGGTARSMTNRIQAEDFDVGGYSVAYRATDVCGIGVDTTYGTDRLNVYPTADLDSESNLKIGCNQAGDWHNYTITAATTGSYTINMRVANIETGTAYHVAIDGATVVKGIAVPNTGGYDTFATVTSAPFGLTSGQHVMGIVLDTAGPSGFGGELNWMQGTLVKAGAIGTKNIDITVTH